MSRSLRYRRSKHDAARHCRPPCFQRPTQLWRPCYAERFREIPHMATKSRLRGGKFSPEHRQAVATRHGSTRGCGSSDTARGQPAGRPPSRCPCPGRRAATIICTTGTYSSAYQRRAISSSVEEVTLALHGVEPPRLDGLHLIGDGQNAYGPTGHHRPCCPMLAHTWACSPAHDRTASWAAR